MAFLLANMRNEVFGIFHSSFQLIWHSNKYFFICGLRKINRKCFVFVYLASSSNVFYYNSVFYAITFGKQDIKSGQSLKVHYHVKTTFKPILIFIWCHLSTNDYALRGHCRLHKGSTTNRYKIAFVLQVVINLLLPCTMERCNK